MAEITAQAVNEFRKKTGLGLMECKALLKEADGDLKKAETLAKERGLKQAELRAGRAAKAGRIEVYIHHDAKSGAMIELNCETDFVARNDEFKQLAKDLALHIMAANPLCVRREDVPAGRHRRAEADLHVPGGRQAGEHPGEDRRGQAQRLVRRERPARPEVRQGRDQDRPRRDPGGQRPHRREHLGGPVRPVHGRRGAVSARVTASVGSRSRLESGHRATGFTGPRLRELHQEDSASWTHSVTAGPPVFRRVLLKLSGESFCRPGEGGISVEEVSRIARQASRVAARGVQLAIVVGGGNILRGAQLSRGSDVIKEATAHYMGMTATVINGLALQDALEHEGCATRLLTTIRMDEVAEPFIRRRALAHLDKGRVVILATGTGSPFVTTDTAAALRGKELGAEVLLKATRVDGVYSADPEKNPHAVLYEHLTFEQVMRDELKVMDMTAIGMCLENRLPILVFNFKKEGNIERAIAGEPIGTWVSNTPGPDRPRAVERDGRSGRCSPSATAM